MCDSPSDVMPKRLRYDKNKNCVRCKATSGNIVIKHSVYCKDCFDLQVSNKFRRALDQSFNLLSHSQYDQPKPSKGVLVVISGGLESAVLTELVGKECFPARSSISRKPLSKREQLWSSSHLAYVELCAAIPDRGDQTEEVLRTVQILSPTHDVTILRIEDAFDPAWWSSIQEEAPDFINTRTNSQAPKDQLTQFLCSLPTPSAVSNMIEQISRLLLLHTATRLQCSHLLLDDSLTSLSISLITSIASGGGFHVGAEREEVWGDIRIVKPLRDISAKECAAFYHWRRLQMLGARTLIASQQGIGRLSRDFIVGLDRDFPSTVSAIVKTCAKVEAKEEPDACCMICQRPTVSSAYAWKTHVSLSQVFPTTPELISPNRSRNALCYECHTALTSRGPKSSMKMSEAPMPMWVMREQINEFLLDE